MHLQKQPYHPMDANNMYHHGSYNTTQIPPEPLPSATDIHTAALSISQMAEFSSTMVYLMWHLRNPSTSPINPSVIHTRPDHQQPFTGASNSFRKYCRTILQQTQLSESVVLLSLKYISLLLRNNPQLRGAEGSEYRLFTVALMLANKFLDDNTFTNKTWSDISGMKVKELNVMEFEFLDVLHFQLFIPKADFDHWKSTLFNFRNQFYDQTIDPNHRALHQQQLIETTLKNMGLPFQYQYQQHDVQWKQQQQQIQQEAVRQQQQQQQAAAAAAAAQQQQQYNQHLYLLSKAQQPHIPPQPLNRPLTRVPLRIPVRPVYQTQAIQASSTPGSHAATVYEPSIGVSVTNTNATVIQPVSIAPPSLISSQQQQQQQQQPSQQPIVQSHNLGTVNTPNGRRTPIVPSVGENTYSATSTYPPSQTSHHPPHPHHHQAQAPPRINTSNSQRPYDYVRTGSDESSAHMNLYPQSATAAQVVTPGVVSHNSYYNNNNNSSTDIYAQPPTTTSQPHMTSSGGNHRTTSLPSASIDATVTPQPPPSHMGLGNNLTPITSASSSQQQQQHPSYYYNTPVATPLTAPASHNLHDHSSYVNGSSSASSSYNTNNNNINNSMNTTSQPNYMNHPSRPIANNPNNPVRPYYMDHTQQQQQQQQQQIITTPSSADYNYGTPVSTNDPYSRPAMGRTSSNPSYQNAYNGQEYSTNTNLYQQDYRTPVPHIQQQLQQQQQQQQQQQPSKKATGPVPEDPLTAADSYRTHINRR
ncbi:unnamed protein product [Cunninghamella echinulata]